MPRSTLQEIIQDGRLAPGMAAVVRRDPDAVRWLHVFIYEHSSIQNWQAGKSILEPGCKVNGQLNSPAASQAVCLMYPRVYRKQCEAS